MIWTPPDDPITYAALAPASLHAFGTGVLTLNGGVIQLVSQLPTSLAVADLNDIVQVSTLPTASGARTDAIYMLPDGTYWRTGATSLWHQIQLDTYSTAQADTLYAAEVSARTNAIATEATTRANADTAEATARIAGDNTEASARALADATLTSNLNSETSNRQTADTTLQNNINAEANTRASAITGVQSNINSEGSARQAADVTLQNNINAEASTRSSADTSLQNNLNAHTGSSNHPYLNQIQTWTNTNNFSGNVNFTGTVTGVGGGGSVAMYDTYDNVAGQIGFSLSGSSFMTMSRPINMGSNAITNAAAINASQINSQNWYDTTGTNLQVQQASSRLYFKMPIDFTGMSGSVATINQVQNINGYSFNDTSGNAQFQFASNVIYTKNPMDWNGVSVGNAELRNLQTIGVYHIGQPGIVAIDFASGNIYTKVSNFYLNPATVMQPSSGRFSIAGCNSCNGYQGPCMYYSVTQTGGSYGNETAQWSAPAGITIINAQWTFNGAVATLYQYVAGSGPGGGTLQSFTQIGTQSQITYTSAVGLNIKGFFTLIYT